MPSSSHQIHASSRPGVGQTHLVRGALACLTGVLLVLAIGTGAQADQDFVLMGKEGAYLKKNSTVASGDVGTNQVSNGPFLAGDEELTVGIGTIVQSPTIQVMGDSIKLKNNAQVYDVHYNEISGLGDILGQEFTPLALPLITAFPPVPSFTPGTQNFDVPQGGTLTLDAGSYGLLKARLGATITLTGGTYDFTEWDVGDNVTIDIEAPTEIRIAGKLAVDQGSTLGPAPGAPTLTANDIVIYVTGINGSTGDLGATPKAAKFGIATTVRAKVFVPNGTLWMRQNGQFTGAFVAKWVILGIGASATFEGGFNLRGVQPGDLTQARAGHSAELLGDGRVLITGGTGAAGVLDSAEVFDPATLASSALANTLTSPRTEHTSTLLPQSETLLVAGEDTFGLLNTTEMFNPGTEAFRSLSPTVQILRSGHTATALLDGRVLITGGQSSGALGDAEIFDAQSAVLFLPPYDPETATFEILQDGLTTPRWDHTATLLADGRILITGGRDGTGVLNTAELFDPTTEAFTTLTGTLSSPRAAHTATLLPDGTVLLLGGEDATNVLATAEIFDPATETFAGISTGLGSPRKNHTATLLPFGQVLITGGNDGTSILATTELSSSASGDTAAPTVSQVLPADAATGVEPNQIVGLRFTEPVDVTTLTSANVTLTNGGTVTGIVSPAEEGLMVFVVPDAPLATGTTYTLSLSSAITDTAGNPLPAFTSTFTTAAEPVITDFTPQQGPEGTEVTITGQNFDPDPSRNEVKFNGVLATVSSATDTTIVTTVPSGATTGPITVTSAGGTATSATDFAVITAPVITDVTPLTGTVGTPVTIAGVNFDTVPSNNQVTFSGETAPVTAIITSAMTTEITTTVPQNARTGPITVTTPQGSDTSAPFTVELSQNFGLSAVPSLATAIAGDQASYTITASGQGNFTSLIALSAQSLPAGVTASFIPPQVAPSGSSTLVLSVSSAVSAGLVSFSVNGQATIDGQQVIQTVPLQVSVVGAGTTAFVGRILNTEDEPLENVQITLLDANDMATSTTTSTDAGGNFVLTNVPVGNQMFFVDGRPAQASPTDTRSYPPVEAVHDIVDGQANRMPHIIYLPAIDTSTTTPTPANNASPIIVTSPDLPDLEIEIPAGTTITLTEPDGTTSTVTEISITGVPVDRAPMPLSPGFDTPLLFTIQPGGAVPQNAEGGVIIRFPNWDKYAAGARVDLFFFDLALRDWRVYGQGTVTADGRQITPDPGVVLPRFAWHGTDGAPAGPGTGKAGSGGDPVDLATGFFTLQATDFVLPGRMPVTLTRHYRTQDPSIGSFGIGTRPAFDVFLIEPSTDQRVLVMPDQTRFNFRKQPDGTFTNFTDPSMQGAVVTESGSDRILTFKDQTRWTFTNDTNGSLLEQRDRNGNTITITRAGLQITAITDSVGRQLTVGIGAGGVINEITDPIGRTVRYAYDAGLRLTTVTDPAGGITRYTYDANSRLVSITDPRGITFLTNEYDSQGRVCRQTQADGGVWQFYYVPADAAVGAGAQQLLEEAKAGGPISLAPCTALGTAQTVFATVVVDPRGNPTTHRFNSNAYLISQTDALGQGTNSERGNGTNLLTQQVDALGRTATFVYDTAGNVIQTIDPAGNKTEFDYHATFNRVTEMRQFLDSTTFLKTVFTYDPSTGDLLSTTNPANETTAIGYNAFGQPTSVTDPLNNTTTFQYDPDGNRIATSDPLGNTTQRAYDALSRLLTLTDPRGMSTQFGYDALNRVTTIVDPSHGITRFTYDPNGNLLSVTDAKGQATTYKFDEFDRLITRTDALNRTELYEYDPNGNLLQFTDRRGNESIFTYDVKNRRTLAQYSDGSSTTFTYDSVSRLAVAEDSSSGQIDFIYDSLDQLVKEITPRGVVEYSYDELGRRSTMTAIGQEPLTYVYDAASRLTQVAQGGLVVGLAYDTAGRRTGLTYPNGTNTTYSYNAASRLLSIVHDGPAGLIESLTYAYDAAGNRISLTRANAAATLLPEPVQAAYDTANEQIQYGNPLPVTPNLTYDANGNLETFSDASGTTTYTWDARNRLVAISGPSLSASFGYDAVGRRITKTVNGVTTDFVYDRKNIVSEIDSTTVRTSYLRSLNLDESFVRQSSTDEYYHFAGLNTVAALTSPAGATVVTYAYEAFGTSMIEGTSGNPFQYTGRENDQTGLYYYRARYYAPALHRFLSEDPTIILEPGSCPMGVFSSLDTRIRILVREDPRDLNLYQYTRNNPIRFSDPEGLQTFEEPNICGRNCLPASFFQRRPKERCKLIDVFPSFLRGTPDRQSVLVGKVCLYACTVKPSLDGAGRFVEDFVRCRFDL